MTQNGHVTQILAWKSPSGAQGASSATFSPCGTYRYDLRRSWQPSTRPLIVIACNPSKADAVRPDHTVTKLLKWATEWGCGSLIVLNVFALRSTDPNALYACADPVGPENDATIMHVLEAHPAARLLFAWGNHGAFRNRGRIVAEMVRPLHDMPECFGVCANGEPMHPLRLPYALRPQPFEACR